MRNFEERVKEHFIEAQKYFDNDHIVGLFLQGSQNYGLATDKSDVDTKLLVTPKVEEIAYNKAPVSTTHVMENKEHIDFKDIRLYFDTFRQQNMNFLEIMFTDYFVINPMYAEAWGRLLDIREQVVRYNPYRAVQAMMGIGTRQFNRVTHMADSNVEAFNQFGYDPKALCNLLRICEFLQKYTMEILTYKECMTPANPDYLLDIKSGYCYPQEAKILANDVYAKMQEIEGIAKSKFPNIPDPEVGKKLKAIQYDIITISMRKDLKV